MITVKLILFVTIAFSLICSSLALEFKALQILFSILSGEFMETKIKESELILVNKGQTNYTFVEYITYTDKRYCSVYEDENTYYMKNSNGEQKRLIKIKCSPYISNGTLTIVDTFADIVDLFAPIGNVTKKHHAGSCALVLFYSRACSGSASVAPHFNALARILVNMKVAAIDAVKHHSLNTKFGIVGLPTIALFHQGRLIVKFNYTTITIKNFIQFISRHTNIDMNITVNAFVTSDDFLGPLPNRVEKDVDIWLIVAWIFIIVCACYYFTKSKLCKQIIEVIKRNWRESEAQHERT